MKNSKELLFIYNKIYLSYNIKWNINNWLWFCHVLSIYSYNLSIYNLIDIIYENSMYKQLNFINFNEFYICCGILSDIIYKDKNPKLLRLEYLLKRFISMDSSLNLSIENATKSHQSISPLQFMFNVGNILYDYEEIFKLLYCHTMNLEYTTSSWSYLKINNIYPTWDDVIKVFKLILNIDDDIINSIQYHDGVNRINVYIIILYRMKKQEEHHFQHLLKEYLFIVFIILMIVIIQLKYLILK